MLEVRTVYVTWHTVANPTKLPGKKIFFKIFHLAEHHVILLKDDLQSVSSATGSGTWVWRPSVDMTCYRTPLHVMSTFIALCSSCVNKRSHSHTYQTTSLQMNSSIESTPYTGCPRRNVPDFGRVFLMLKYANITQNTYVRSWTVTEIMAREKCGLLAGPHTVPVSWQSYPCQSLSVVSYDSISSHARLIPECAVSLITSLLGSHLSCIVLGTLRTTMTWVGVFL